MKFYKKGNKYTCVNSTLTRYYERNFEFDKSWDIPIPKIQSIKNPKEPYSGIDKKEFILWLKEVGKEHLFQAEKIRDLLREIDTNSNKLYTKKG